ARADLARAGAQLRAALTQAPGGAEDPPAEILLESFHLAEAEDQPLLARAGILMRALFKNPAPALRYRAEAERFLDEAERRETEALTGAGGDPALLDLSAATRAFEAATVRYTALLYTGLEDAGVLLARARLEQGDGRFRRALARYRALLAWTLPRHTDDAGDALRGDERLEAIARQGDLLIEASQVAQRVDAELAAFYRTQGQWRIGVELLAKDQNAMARLKLQSAVDADPELAPARLALARAHARLDDEAAAERELLEALRQAPDLRAEALAAPDLVSVRRRNAVKLRLGLP
ncbi:MAG: hypothetical protein O2894_02420, partial [Planctomycetota bacterium]|nr:hypothetical protein [Planctomycetota bacterium]